MIRDFILHFNDPINWYYTSFLSFWTFWLGVIIGNAPRRLSVKESEKLRKSYYETQDKLDAVLKTIELRNNVANAEATSAADNRM